VVTAACQRSRPEGGCQLSLIQGITQNKTLIAPVAAWLIAQTLKVPLSFDRHTGVDFQRLVSPGGMPSAHSALATALATIAGLVNGWDSSLFGMAVVFAMIVMYDAAGIRQAAGKQARILNQMIAEWHVSKRFRDVKLRELLGHTPVEVFVGALIGVVTAFIVFSL